MMDNRSDNRFGLLFESEDVDDNVVQKKKVQKAKPIASAPNSAAKKVAEKQPKEKIDEKKGLKEEKENRGSASGKKIVGDKKFPKENGEKIERKPRDNQRFQRDRNNQQPRDGKRQFDRQSGSDKTGVKAVEKRNGAGSHNWGSVKQDIDLSLEDLDQQNTTTATTTEDEQTATGPKEESIVEPKVLTLDEWKAQQELKRGAKPQYNIRKAGEGESISPQWEKMIALKKASKKTDEEEFDYEVIHELYPQRVGRKQRIVDIQFNFNDGRRGGGVGGGAPGGGRFRNKKAAERSGGGGGGGAGAAGGDNVKFTRAKREVKQQHAPKVDDVRQFPTLS